jgi:hypothetical protein
MNASAPIADSLRWGIELRVSGFMFRVVRKDDPNTRNPELETRNPKHFPERDFATNRHE